MVRSWSWHDKQKKNLKKREKIGATRSSLTVSLDLHFGHSNRMLAIQTGTARSSSAIPETWRTWRASENVRLTEKLRETLTSNCRIEARLLQVGTPPYISPNDENTGIGSSSLFCHLIWNLSQQ